MRESHDEYNMNLIKNYNSDLMNITIKTCIKYLNVWMMFENFHSTLLLKASSSSSSLTTSTLYYGTITDEFDSSECTEMHYLKL